MFIDEIKPNFKKNKKIEISFSETSCKIFSKYKKRIKEEEKNDILQSLLKEQFADGHFEFNKKLIELLKLNWDSVRQSKIKDFTGNEEIENVDNLKKNIWTTALVCSFLDLYLSLR